MRWKAMLLMSLVSSPALAASPKPLCALPGPMAMSAAIKNAPKPIAPISPVAPSTTAPTAPSPVPRALVGIPFVKHVVDAGAAVINLGEVHGLRAFAARSGDRFMLFQVAPDGAAAVSGAPIDLSVAQLRSIAGGSIRSLGVSHGLDGYFVRSGQRFQVFYALPNGARVIPGVLWDDTGKDLTREQVAHVPGAVPTVRVGTAGAANGQEVSGTNALKLMHEATFDTIGSRSAPRVFMLIDPQCIYSMRAFRMLQGYVDAGRLRLSIIPLSVLDYEDHGQSTRSALALLSDPANQIVANWQAGRVSNTPTATGAARLRKNMAIAEAIRLKGTPTFIWRKANGTEGRLNGVPTNVSSFVASVGS